MRPTSWDRSRWIALPRWLTSPAPRPWPATWSAASTPADALQRLVGLNGLIDIAGDIVRGASSISGRLSTLIRTPETLALQLQGLYQQLTQAIKRPKSAIADLRAEYGSHDPTPWTAPVGSASPPQGATSARREVNTAAMQEFTRTQVIATQARILTDAIEARK